MGSIAKTGPRSSVRSQKQVSLGQARTHLFAYRRDVRESCLVCKYGKPVASDHTIELLVRFALDVRIEKHRKDNAQKR